MTTNNKGITKDFFNQPIPVPVTFRRKVKVKGKFQDKDFPVLFMMNRATVGQTNALEVAKSLFSDSDNFERFCTQLASIPEGIDDFPKDKRPIEQRAREYFAGGGYRALIQHVVMEVERASVPVEFFQSF